MDDFQWLEDKPPQKHHQWLKDYWLHIIAAVVILSVLLLLLFNPATKSSHSHTDIRLAEALHLREANEAAEQEQEAQKNVPKKQILIRMPDKSVKQVEGMDDVKKTSPTTKSAPSTTLIRSAPKQITSKEIIPEKIITEEIVIEESDGEIEVEIKEVAPAQIPPPPASIGTLNKAVTPTPKPAPVSKPEPIVEKAPVQTPPPVVATPPKIPAPKATPPAAASGDSALYTMLKRTPTHYVIQLFGSDNEASVKSFIAKNNLSKEALYVTVWYNNQNWYIVLYGDYANRGLAQTAVQELPPNLSNNSPWPRSVQSVQEAIRQRLIREGME